MAVSIPPGTLILPAGYLQRRSLRSDVASILDEASRRDAVAVVAGIPYDAQGRPGEQARKIATLVRALERSAGIPVALVDESFTSAAAETELRQSGHHPGRRRGEVDAAAAAAILRRFLAS